MWLILLAVVFLERALAGRMYSGHLLHHLNDNKDEKTFSISNRTSIALCTAQFTGP